MQKTERRRYYGQISVFSDKLFYNAVININYIKPPINNF